MPRTGRPPSWSPEQLEYLREQAKTRPALDIAREMGMPIGTARWYIKKKWGMQIISHYKDWTAEEETRLRDLRVDHSLEQIAEKLGRTVDAVKTRIHKLGLRLPQSSSTRREWTKHEDVFLYRAAERMSLREAGKALGRSVNSVYAHCRKIGIKWAQGRRTLREVALDLGCCHTYVRVLAKKHNIQLVATKGGGPMNISDEQYKALLDAWFGPTSVDLAA
jgi:DNA-binding CsgD family transcriptional regulator